MENAIKTEAKGSFRWIMLLFVCLFYFTILGFTNQSFNLLLGTITEDLGWTTTQRTAIAGAMSSGMIWFVFVAGTLLDRFSVKKILGSAAAICAILIFIRGQAEGFMMWYAMMFVFGVASAFYMPATTKMISLWFTDRDLALANGFLTASSPLGQLTANFFSVKLMYAVGSWQTMYTLVGICIMLITVFYFVIGKERKGEDAALTSTFLEKADLSFWKNIGGVLKVPMVWVYIVANTFFLGSIYAGGALGPVIYQQDPNWMLDVSISGLVPAANNMASMCAYILVPLFIAKIGRHHYRKIAIIGGLIAPMCFFMGIRSYNLTTVMIFYAIAGIMYGAIVPAPKVLMLQLPEIRGQRAGTALGAYVTIERIGITAGITLLGGLISANPDKMAVVLSNFFLIQLISPLLILLAGMAEKKKKDAAVEKL